MNNSLTDTLLDEQAYYKSYFRDAMNKLDELKIFDVSLIESSLNKFMESKEYNGLPYPTASLDLILDEPIVNGSYKKLDFGFNYSYSLDEEQYANLSEKDISNIYIHFHLYLYKVMIEAISINEKRLKENDISVNLIDYNYAYVLNRNTNIYDFKTSAFIYI